LAAFLLASPGIALAISAKPLLLGDEMLVLGIFWALILPTGFLITISPSWSRAVSIGEPTVGTVEDLLAKVEALPAGTLAFELYVPDRLTLDGQPIAQNPA
jgi:hypothetical protein